MRCACTLRCTWWVLSYPVKPPPKQGRGPARGEGHLPSPSVSLASQLPTPHTVSSLGRGPPLAHPHSEELWDEAGRASARWTRPCLRAVCFRTPVLRKECLDTSQAVCTHVRVRVWALVGGELNSWHQNPSWLISVSAYPALVPRNLWA